jgi:hypothetical protein
VGSDRKRQARKTASGQRGLDAHDPWRPKRTAQETKPAERQGHAKYHRPSWKEGQARSEGEATRQAGGTKKYTSVPHAPRSREQTEDTSPKRPRPGTNGAPVHVSRVERKGLGRVVQKTRPKLSLGEKNRRRQRAASCHKSVQRR